MKAESFSTMIGWDMWKRWTDRERERETERKAGLETEDLFSLAKGCHESQRWLLINGGNS